MAIPIPKDFFGQSSDAPQGITAYGQDIPDLVNLLNNLLKVAVFGSMIFALINFLISGIQYAGSGGNPEYIKAASSRIWISVLGLIVAAGSLVIAGILGYVFFRDPMAIINPTVYGPGI